MGEIIVTKVEPLPDWRSIGRSSLAINLWAIAAPLGSSKGFLKGESYVRLPKQKTNITKVHTWSPKAKFCTSVTFLGSSAASRASGDLSMAQVADFY